jgi:hypothetical protein
MEQLGLFAAPPPPRPFVAAPAAKPAPVAAQPRKTKREPQPAAQLVVIDAPQLPPLGAFAKIEGRWHRWKTLGWEVVRPPEHSAHLRDTPPSLGSNGWINEPHPTPATIHMGGHTLRVEWSEHGFSVHSGEHHLLHFRALAGCAVGAAEIARADPHFQTILAALDQPEPEQPTPAAPGPDATAAAPVDAEHSRFWQSGFDARREGAPRRVPGYLLEAYRDTPEKVRLWKQAEWLAGWEAAPAPARVEYNERLPLGLDDDALKLFQDYSLKIIDADARGRLITYLAACLARKRECQDHYSKKEKAEHAKRLLDRTDVRRAYRSICPRPFAAVAADAWTVVDEYDRLCRSPDGGDGSRRHALNCALDELFVEANGGDTCGTGVFHGPKRLRKALRVRARAEKRWPMWGVEGRFRFDWRGLTMICETRWGGIHLDTDRHPIGTLCHSSTGFRSFSGDGGPLGCSPQESKARMLDTYVDGSTKDGMGLGGKLETYVPWWIDHYRQALEYQQRADANYRAECPGMTPADERPAYWVNYDAKFAEQQADAERKAAAAGIDLGDFIPALKAKRQGSLL